MVAVTRKTDETVYEIDALAKEKAAAFGAAIEETEERAEVKLAAIARGFLELMKDGDEHIFPIYSPRGEQKAYVFKKVSNDKFSVRIRTEH